MDDVGPDFALEEQCFAFSRYRKHSTGESVAVVQYMLPEMNTQGETRTHIMGFIDLLCEVSHLAIPTPLEVIETRNYCYMLYRDLKYNTVASIVEAYARTGPLSEDLFWDLSGELVATMIHLQACMAESGYILWINDLSPLNVLIGTDNHVAIINLTSLQITPAESMSPVLRTDPLGFPGADGDGDGDNGTDILPVKRITPTQSMLDYCAYVAEKAERNSQKATDNYPYHSLQYAGPTSFVLRSLGTLLYYLSSGVELETLLAEGQSLEEIVLSIDNASSERKAFLLGLLYSGTDGHSDSMTLQEVYRICCQQAEKRVSNTVAATIVEAMSVAHREDSDEVVSNQDQEQVREQEQKQGHLDTKAEVEAQLEDNGDTVDSLRIRNTHLEECTAKIMAELEQKTQEVTQLRAQLKEALKQGEEFAKQLPLFQKEIASLKRKLDEKSGRSLSPDRSELEEEIASLREELRKAYSDLQVEITAKEELASKLMGTLLQTSDASSREVEILREKVAILQEKIQDRDDLITDLYTSLHSLETIKLPTKALDLLPDNMRSALGTQTLNNLGSLDLGIGTAQLEQQLALCNDGANDTGTEAIAATMAEVETGSALTVSTDVSDNHGTRQQLTEISAMIAATASPDVTAESPSIDTKVSAIITNSVQRLTVPSRSISQVERGLDELRIRDLESRDLVRETDSPPGRSRSIKNRGREITVKEPREKQAYVRGAAPENVIGKRPQSKSAKVQRARTPSPKVDTHQFARDRSPARDYDPSDRFAECKLPNQMIRLRSELTPADKLIQRFNYNSEYTIKSGEKGYTPLMEVICNMRQPRAASTKSSINFKSYMEYIGQQSEQGVTALMIASMKNNEPAVRFLARHEASLLTAEGYSALYLALISNNIGIAKILLPYEGFADEDDQAPKEKGMTSLMSAAASNDIVKAFIYMDSQRGKQTHSGWTALMFAAEHGHAEICQLLVAEEKCLKNGDMETALMLAVRNGHKNCVRVLATSEKGCQNRRGQTALMLASIAGHVSIVNILTNLEAGKNAYVSDKETGYTALIYAIKYKRKECIEKLAQREGKKPDMRGNLPRVFAPTNEILRLCQVLGVQ